MQDDKETTDEGEVRPDQLRAQDFVDKITYAFQLATNQGPLCNEPMQGVAVFVDTLRDEVERCVLGRGSR